MKKCCLLLIVLLMFVGCTNKVNISSSTTSSASSTITNDVTSKDLSDLSSESSNITTSEDFSSTSSSGEVIESNELEYTLSENKDSYIVTGIGTCKKTDIVIPSTFESLPVKEIGNNAFSGCNLITSIEIPNSVIRIGEYAFYDCSSLTSIEIPNSVIEIENYTFFRCSSLISMVIPNNVTKIGEGAFADCVSLTSIEIPNSIKSIGEIAFLNCNSLISVVIPNSVTSIELGAFSDCGSLESITLPFIGSSLNETLYTHFGYIFGSFTYSGNLNYVPASLKKVIVTGGGSIGGYSFFECNSLISVVISDGVTSIEDFAFNGCSSLTSIEIPNSVTSIGNYAFDGCNSLQYYEYGNCLYLGNEENQHLVLVKTKDVSISEVTISNDTKLILSSAFKNCIYLANVYFNGTIEDWCKIRFGYYDSNPMYYASNFYNLNESNEYKEVTEIVIPDNITSIDDYQFYGFGKITKVEIPNSVTYIGYNAFTKCNSLSDVYFNGKIEDWCKISIAHDESNPMYYASNFYNLNENNQYVELTETIIPDTITSIEGYQFYGFDKITKVEIPSSVTYIAYNAFAECSSLFDVYYNGTIEDWCKMCFVSADSNPMYYASNFYLLNENNEYEELTEIIIPDTITSIGNYQFYGFNKVTNVTIPNSVTNMGISAFNGYNSLESITIPFVGATLNGTSNTHFGYIFGASTYSDNSKYVPSSLKEVTITGGTSIGDWAFSHCNSVILIEIPNSVASIGEYAFSNCSSLASIEIPNNVTIIEDYAFSECSSLAIYCEASSQLSGWNDTWNYARWNNYYCPVYWGINENNYLIQCGVIYVVIDGNAIVTGHKTNINKVVIPSTIIINGIIYNVTQIKEGAFQRCNSLTSIVISSSLTIIEDYAFSECSSLTIYCEASSKPNGWNVWWNNSERPVYWANQWSYVDGVPTPNQA